MIRAGAPGPRSPRIGLGPWGGDLDSGTWAIEDLDAAGFVLAGGQSSRMGTDKALVEFDGQPLIAHVLDLLRGAGLRPSIAGARSPLEPFAPVVPDSEPGQGPLGGICTALRTLANQRYAVFLPVDLPLLPVSLVVYLLHHASITSAAVTLPSVNAFPQTFPAVLARDTLPALENELAAGRLGCYAAFQAAASGFSQPVSTLPVEILVQSGKVGHSQALPPNRWFVNLNSPQDLRRAALGRAVA